MHSYRGGSPFPLQYNQLRVSTGPTVSVPVTRDHRLEVVQWGQICVEYLGVYFFVHYTIYSLNLHISHDEVTESSFFFKNVQKFKDTFFSNSTQTPSHTVLSVTLLRLFRYKPQHRAYVLSSHSLLTHFIRRSFNIPVPDTVGSIWQRKQ